MLARGGVRSLDQLLAMNIRELLDLPGVGRGTAARITTSLAEVGLELAADPWGAYVCARHTVARGDTGLAQFWLCDDCEREFVRNALADELPCFVGGRCGGLCSHCQAPSVIAIRQWLLCPVCERVLRSIGKGVVSARYVLDRWSAVVQPHLPELDLVETDPPAARPRGTGVNADKEVVADFTAFRRSSGEPIFGVELKSGPGKVGRVGGIGAQMRTFQLDQSDCDDIIRVSTETGLPVFLYHCQVGTRAAPPTSKYTGLGLWWTDVLQMAQHFASSKVRPRETKVAAYYNTAMFQPIPTFAEFIRGVGFKNLRKELHRDGLPSLY